MLGRCVLFVFVCVLTACSGAGAPQSVVPPSYAGTSTSTSIPSAGVQKIRHVVVVIQENRSFDNLFQGYPGANTVSSGMDKKGHTIPLHPVPLEQPGYGIGHVSTDFFAACDGTGTIPGTNCRMDGFDKELVGGTSVPRHAPYGYVPHRETKLYFDMAKQYVLADNMFASHIDASFVSHQYIVAGQASHAVDLPSPTWGCSQQASVSTLKDDRRYGAKEAPCFDSPSIAGELDARGLPWHYYAANRGDSGALWEAYQAISPIYNSAEFSRDVIAPSTQFLSDVRAGVLGAVTWITPACLDSDHLGCLSNTGPQWVASIVNAIGESPYWNSTTIFVMWDEWGGWYDHVPPPYVDYDGLGFRVPLLIISPYAKHGHVSHVQYEHGSILRYIEDTFGLPRLAASDVRANSAARDSLDMSKPPRPFIPFATSLTPQDRLLSAHDSRAIDEE